jgi:hypothetical protein
MERARTLRHHGVTVDTAAGDRWMSEREQDKSQIAGMDGQLQDTHDLPYAVELWSKDGQGVERVLARAINMTLARAIYLSAQKEHPDRRIVLRHLSSVVDQIS